MSLGHFVLDPSFRWRRDLGCRDGNGGALLNNIYDDVNLYLVCLSESHALSLQEMPFSEWSYFSHVSLGGDASAPIWCGMPNLARTQLIYYTLACTHR